MKATDLPPAGYMLIRDSRTTITVRQDYKEHLLPGGADDLERIIMISDEAYSAYTGRGEILSSPIAGTSERMVIRECRRGGLFGLFIKDMYWGMQRPFKELAVAAEAVNRGVLTAPVLAAVAVKVSGSLYRGYLITKELPTCKDLPYIFSNVIHRQSEKREILGHVARAIRRMHEKGFYHADLNLKNVLIDLEDTSNVYIIDWDKSTIHESISWSERSKNILRFCRSMEKFKTKGLPMSKGDQLFFLKAYWEGAENARKRARRDFLRMRLSNSLRRSRWKVEKVFDKGHQ